MKKIINIILLLILTACTQTGFVNIKIHNLASKEILIEGQVRNICNAADRDKSIQDFCKRRNSSENFVKYEGDVSQEFGTSKWLVRWRWSKPYLERKNQFIDSDNLRIYYKSKSCLIFEFDQHNNTLISLYLNAFREKKILVLTNNGLEVISKEDYESSKGKYRINDSNVRCLRDVK